MAESRRCDNCGQQFANLYQFGSHRRMCYNREAPAQYDKFSAGSGDSSDSSASAASAASAGSAGSASSAASAHEQRVNILSLARRPPALTKWGIQKDVCVSSTRRYDPHYTADYTEVNLHVRSSIM